MNWIINMVSKLTGIDAVTKKLDGANTKLAGLAAILSGVAGLVLQWIAMPHDIVSIINFIKALPMDPSWLAIIGGWAALGLGRKMEKASADVQKPTPVEPPQP